MSSKDLFDLKIIDEIIMEPLGGAHRDKDQILNNVKSSISKNLDFFANMDSEDILLQRKNKFLSIGRGGGFSATKKLSKDLSFKESFIDKFSNKYYKYKNYILISLIISTLLLIFYFL
tara:strand:- start:165 stop:518 length:354 start_codon:yes stop_codon:yes gene_type:complete